MNKAKFEAYLRDQLSVLAPSEVDEIVAEYIQHIDMRVLDGISEEEAILDFGDLDELVNDLLDAYKINRENRELKKFEFHAKRILNKSLDFINDVARSLMRLSSSEIISLVVQFIIVLIVMKLVDIVGESISSVFIRMLWFRPYFITGILRFIIEVLRFVLTLTINLSILVWFAKERIIKESDFDKSENFTQTSEVIVKEKSIDENEIIDEVKTVKYVNRPEIKVSNSSFTTKALSINLRIIKIIVLIILIPAIVASVLSGIFYVWLLFATISGYGSLGLLMILSGGLLVMYSLVIWGINFVGGSRHEKSSNNL